MIKDKVIDVRDITDRSIDLHLAVPLILVEQLVVLIDHSEPDSLASVVRLDHQRVGEATEDLERQDLTILVVIECLERGVSRTKAEAQTNLALKS